VSPEQAVAAARQLTGVVRQVNPWVKYVDGVGHGFVVVDVTRRRVQADYYLTPVPTTDLPDPRVDPDVEPAHATSWQTLRRSRRVVAVEEPVKRRRDEPYVRHGRH
jgi:alkaline phosphatase D